MSKPVTNVAGNIEQLGALVQCITQGVQQFNINPHSPVAVRVGDFGPFMVIEHVKVANGGIILQVKAP